MQMHNIFSDLPVIILNGLNSRLQQNEQPDSLVSLYVLIERDDFMGF